MRTVFIQKLTHMLKLTLDHPVGRPLNILFLGAHSDDIEIGCGGTVLKLIDMYPDLQITWIVFGAREKRAFEAATSAESFLSGVKDKKVIIKDFKDGFFPYIGGEIKEWFEQLKKELSPDLIFTHHRHDLHQDHRLICELTWNTFRNHFILEYEIPKYDGDLGVPNIFFHLGESICQKKIHFLMEHFKTQSDRHWFTEETFSSLMRLRGIESKSPDQYAEAFYGRKVSI